jgi:hypothetical protein
MSYVHPAWLEHRRAYLTRHDAHRFEKPEPIQRKTYSERLIEQRQAEEEEAQAKAEHEAFEREVLQLRREWAELKLELVLRQLRLKYDSNQPRVPKGNSDGGQWTKEGAGEAGKGPVAGDSGDAQADSSGLVLSDESPDPIEPGAQYAQAQIVIHENALTGIEDVDRTTRALTKRLATIADTVPAGFGPLHGMAVHGAFKTSLIAQPIPGVEWEVSFGGNYGAKGRLRPDIVYRPFGQLKAFYDIKTGSAEIEDDWAAGLRTFTKPEIPIIELSVTRGVSRKSRNLLHWGICHVLARLRSF